MPLKEAIMPLLRDVDEVAALTRSVNTVVLAGSPRADNNIPRGYNTDVAGIVTAVAETGLTDIESATVLGAGATARSAVVAAKRLSARSLHISARRPEALQQLAEIATLAGFQDVSKVPWSDARSTLDSDLVISTVPKGGADWLAADGPVGRGTLLDVVYDPWPTPLAAHWVGPVVPGLAMLLWQAVVQIRMWADFDPNVEAMRAALGLTPPAR
jgi:shikimate dehydrogenase